MQKIGSFLDHFDELKSFYGSICDKQIDLVKDVIANLLDTKPIFKQPIDNNYHYLLDFSDFDNDDCNFYYSKKFVKN